MVAPALPVLPLWTAMTAGAFDRRDLALVPSVIGSTSGTTAALLRGDIDIAVTSPDAALSDEGNVTILAGLADRPPLSLVCQPRITSFEGLRGEQIGTTSLQEGTVQLIQAIMSANGLHYPGDYGFTLAGAHPQRWEALRSGHLAAALQLMPYDYIAAAEGFTILAEAEDYVPSFAFSSVCVTRRWLDHHGERAAAIADALREGETVIRTHPDRAAAVAAEQARISLDHARRCVNRLLDGVMPPGLVHSAAALEATRRAMETLETAGPQAAAGE